MSGSTKRLALVVGALLLTVGLATPAISSQSTGRNWLGLSSGTRQLRPISPRGRVSGSRKPSSAAAKLFRKQGYLVPNQAAYERAKAADAARARQSGQATEAPKASAPKVIAPKMIGPKIISGDPDIYPAWTGSSDSNVTPPDTTGAIGPSRYIQLVNDKYSIYDRTGNVISSGGLQDFAGANTDIVTDPQVIWDPGTNRFYYVVLEFSHFVGGPNPDNRLYIGYSRTSSPNGIGNSNWCTYIFSYGDFLPDYPKLGDSSNFWLIGSNVYDAASVYQGSDVAWATKPPKGTGCAVLTGGDLPGPLLLDDASQAFTPVPGNQIDTNGTGYVAAAPDVSGGGSATFIDTYGVTKAVDGSASFAAPVRHDVSSYTKPPNAPQAGTASLLDTLDGRLTTAVVAFDPSMGSTALWTQHTVAGGAGSEVNWYELAPAINVPFRSGALTDATLYAFNAAISPDRLVSGRTSEFGDAFVIGFNTSSASDDVRIQMVSQYADHTMSEFVQVKASPGFNDDFSCPVCRWGDYSGASPDPAANPFSNHGQVWLSNQWNVASASPSDVDWRTYIWGTHPVPYVVLTGPTGLFQKGTKFGVSWALGNQASAADVQYRQAPSTGGFGPPVLWQSQVPAGSAIFTGDPGNTYCFSAQSYDDTATGPRPWGFTGERCAVVPLDDRALGGKGWSRLTGKGFFLNTFSQTTQGGRRLIRSGINAKSVQVMVETCPTCGTIQIYWNNVLKHTYSLFASRTHRLVYLSAVSFGSPQSGTLKIVVSGSGKPVIIDALAVSAV